MTMTIKQKELIVRMYKTLSKQFDFGTIGKKSMKKLTVNEASELIKLNQDLFWVIENEGQCTIRQYETLTKIANRSPKIERKFITFIQAQRWINEYSN